MMGKYLYIAEKPSVARAFADVLGNSFKKNDGYLESENVIVTWCVGHLVTMSYPEKYDEKYKKWRMENLPFLPSSFLYEIIPNAKKQFNIVKNLLNRKDVKRIYVCTDSGREGEYIYRLVRQESGIKDKDERRVWINSQTADEIKRGIDEAKPISDYDRLSDSAYLRAKEDYLMGINFSRALSIKYGNTLAQLTGKKYMAIAAGRVMSCVLGMVVQRERQIRGFEKRPFFRVFADLDYFGTNLSFEYKNKSQEDELSGFPTQKQAEDFIKSQKEIDTFVTENISKKKEKRGAPLLFNLAELQSEASKIYKISPDETLSIAQILYERGLTTYPRTDARVLSTAVAKEIGKNLNGLYKNPVYTDIVGTIHKNEYYKKIAKSKYVNDKKITDHYAIIPTGEGYKKIEGLSELQRGIYDLIVKRFLSIFFPESVYEKIEIHTKCADAEYVYKAKLLIDKGYLILSDKNIKNDEVPIDIINKIKKGTRANLLDMEIKQGETTPPKRYTSGSMILAMENAGKLIEDEDLRAQISSAGIGTSATRAGIIEKLCKNKYIHLEKKSQQLTPTLTGELIYDVLLANIGALLVPELTASWEKGLTLVEEGSVTVNEYMEKLSAFIVKYTDNVKGSGKALDLSQRYRQLLDFYPEKSRRKSG